ncbi:hypothetical protein RB2083_1008 [Rhodobacteraceae bacterium HTCC2083]|nr:hypothetical protein RB2083_1008 [Rhodobacteraceae bacterium HTCC2083]
MQKSCKTNDYDRVMNLEKAFVVGKKGFDEFINSYYKKS